MVDLIDRILTCRSFAVTGVSRSPAKFGHRIYLFLKGAGIEVNAVNPNAHCLGEDRCYASLFELPICPGCVVTVTQPWITTATAKEAAILGIPYLWMQPGFESREGIAAAESAGIEVVHGGPCVMVELARDR